MHNPRAEAAKEEGCSMEEFFRLMREDDALDADLTDLGRNQAKRCNKDHFVAKGDESNCNPLGIDLVVASSLSRTIDTADLVLPAYSIATADNNDGEEDAALPPPRISIDKFREVNGNLLNGKRRTKSELEMRNPNWNFDSLVTEDDELWTTEMEEFGDAAERGYLGLVELLTGESNTILLVCHGGILRYTMNMHPLVHLSDERTITTSDDIKPTKTVESRFDNCELRKYRLSWKDGATDSDAKISGEESRRAIVLTQIDE